MNINPSRSFYNITELSKKLEIPTYILRFWEQKFEEIQPRKNKNRRYYREEDVRIIEKIKFLLYEKGYTIKGVQKYFQELKNSKNNQSSEIFEQEKFVKTNSPAKEDDNETKNKIFLVNIEEMEILLEKLLNIRNNIPK